MSESDEAAHNRRKMFRIGVALVIAGVVLVIMCCIIMLAFAPAPMEPAVGIIALMGIIMFIVGWALAGPEIVN